MMSAALGSRVDTTSPKKIQPLSQQPSRPFFKMKPDDRSPMRAGYPSEARLTGDRASAFDPHAGLHRRKLLLRAAKHRPHGVGNVELVPGNPIDAFAMAQPNEVEEGRAD